MFLALDVDADQIVNAISMKNEHSEDDLIEFIKEMDLQVGETDFSFKLIKSLIKSISFEFNKEEFKEVLKELFEEIIDGVMEED